MFDLTEGARNLIRYLWVFQHGPIKKKLEISQGEWAVLAYLERMQVTTPTQIANEFSLTTARIANILNSLEKKGYVHRRNDSVDRRKVFVTITAEGRKISKEKTAEVEHDMVNLLQDLGPEDAETFLTIMKKISDLAKEKIAGTEQKK